MFCLICYCEETEQRGFLRLTISAATPPPHPAYPRYAKTRTQRCRYQGNLTVRLASVGVARWSNNSGSRTQDEINRITPPSYAAIMFTSTDRTYGFLQ
ncbi:hypothetical protein Tco_0734157 [Tanacetum coccineum]